VFISSVKNESYFLFRKLLHSGKSQTWPDLLDEVMEISDLESGPLLLYFKKLESYLAELEQLEPIKPSRFVAVSTSTEAPPSTVITVSESLNATDIDISVNSTISSVEPNSAVNESETNSATGTVVVLGCVGIAVVAIVIAFFMFGRQHFSKKAYTPTSTQET
jgi:hypothetical protein